MANLNTDRSWTTPYTRLWMRFGDTVRYGGDVALEDIHLTGNDNGDGWTCSYCGSRNVALNCEHCNAPRKTRLRQGTATLRGRLPSAAFLTEIDGKFDMQVLHAEYGDPLDYCNGRVIFWAQNCAIKETHIESLTILSPTDTAVVSLCTTISGTFSLHPEDREEIRWIGL